MPLFPKVQVAHRDDGENSVDNSGSNGGVDWLLDASFVEDSCRIVKDLKNKGQRVKEII